MFIKEVRVENFLSIKNEIIWSDLHHGLNIIAGQNGTGKSNFLKAIRFVFDSEFPSQNEKQRICNNEKKPAIVKITVEDPNNRFMIDEDMMIFSRKFYRKKDSFFINNKSSSKQDFVQFFERAKIFCKNPFFIVSQGEASRIAKATNSERLEMFNNISLQAYAKRSETTIDDLEKAFEEKMSLLEEAIGKLGENVEVLQEENVEKKKCKQLKRDVDCIKQIIACREIEKIDDELNNLNNNAKIISETEIREEDNFSEIVEELNDCECVLRTQVDELKIMMEKKRQLLFNHEKNKTNKHEMNVKINYLEEKLHQLESNEKKQVEKLTEKISALDEFDTNSTLETSGDSEENNRQIVQKDFEIKELLSKMGRRKYLSNKAERDNAIKAEIDSLQEQKMKIDTKVKKISEDIKIQEEMKSQIEGKINDAESEINRQELKIKGYSSSFKEFINKQTECLKKSGELREELYKKEKNLAEVKLEFETVEKNLRKCLSAQIYDSVKSVNKIIDVFRECEESTEEYCGILLNCFTLKRPEYQNIIDDLAGNQLFHFVVETTDYALKILEKMSQLDLPGEANFLPLDQLQVSEKNLNIKDAVNTILMLNYDEQYDKAIRMVFGNTWVCKDFKTAARIAKKYKVTCCTTNGEMVTNNGLAIGGFSNKLKSRGNIYKTKESLENKCKILESELKEINENIQRNNQTKLSIQNENLTQTIQAEQRTLEVMKMNLKDMNIELNSLKKGIALGKKYHSELQLELKKILSKIENLQGDLNEEEWNSQLTEEEENRMKTLREELHELRVEKHKMVLESLKNSPKSNQQGKKVLKKIIEVTKNEIETIATAKNEIEMEIKELKLQLINFMNDDISLNFQKNHNEDYEKLQTKIQEMKEERQILKDKRDQFEESLLNTREQKDEINSLIKNLESDREKHVETICNVNSKSSKEEFFKEQSNEFLYQKLGEYEAKYQKMKKKVNLGKDEMLQEAIDFQNKLEDEMEKLNNSESMRECLRKHKNLLDDTVADQYQDMSQKFNEYFKKFEPNGSVELIKETNSLSSGVQDTLIGINIKVEILGEQKILKSLSGGEKSCVSLAFIFAALEINLPPFLIFDEVDAALSKENCNIFGKILRSVCQNVQIFMVSFKQQSMSQGDKFFKVTSVNSHSKIESVPSFEEISN